ncbi:MAG: hypothetical protein V1655_00600, partial [bacterium]
MKPNFQKFIYRKHAVLTDNVIVEAWKDEKRFCQLTGLRGVMQNLEIIDGHYCIDMNWLDGMVKKYENADTELFRKFTQ